MSLKTLNSILLIATVAISLISCKKKQEEALPSLNGLLKIEGIDTFISAESSQERTIKLKPKGATHPNGKGVGYYWRVSPVMNSYDTTRYENGLDKNGEESDGSFTYTFRDTLGTMTIYCYAFASGYNGLSATGYTTLVRPGFQSGEDGPKTTLSNIDFIKTGTRLSGDDLCYYVTIGDQDWTANNIGIQGKGVAFRGYEIMSEIFGRYYSYDEAKAVCESLPADGGNKWRLPTDEDWVNMIKNITADAKGDFSAEKHNDIFWSIAENGSPSLTSRLIADGYFNGEKIWDYWPEIGNITNTSNMSIIPVGYCNLGITPELKSTYPSAHFEDVYEIATFWTADEVADNPDMAYYRYLNDRDPHFMIAKGYKNSFGASVRCVRETL